MKKIILSIFSIFCGTILVAQTEFDAQKLIQPDIIGTARYMGMAGAFSALGGDASAIKDNPAGLGIYRSSEITATASLMYQISNSVWSTNKTSDNLLNTGFDNIAYIMANSTYRSQSGNSGLLNSNWSFSYNRLKSFERNSAVSAVNQASSITDYMAYFTGGIKSADLSNTSTYNAYENTSIPWISVMGFNGWLINESVNSGVSSWSSLLSAGELVTPSFSIQERGYLDEYSIGWAGNFDNLLYVGLTGNLQSVNYNMTSQYKEIFGNGGGMTLSNYLTTTGIGVNMNLGLIYRPTDLLRLGLAVHTPTVLSLSDNNSANMDYYISSTNNGNFDSPSGSNSYLLSTPWKINASAAYLLGQKGLISFEYAKDFSTSSYYMNSKYSTTSFTDENKGMKTLLKDVQTIKIGFEYKCTQNLALRIGYANISAGTSPTADLLLQPYTTRTDVQYFQNNFTNFYTLGFGYRETNWYIDLALVNKNIDETFYAYNTFGLTKLNPTLASVNPANINLSSSNLVFTIGLKF